MQQELTLKQRIVGWAVLAASMAALFIAWAAV